MIPSIWTLIIPTKRTLHSVDTRITPQLIKQCHSRSRLLRLLIAESRVRIHKEGIDRAHNKREEPRVFRLLALAPIHEDVFAAGVTMKVAKECNFTFFGELGN